jgi:hypothetical protein
VPSVRCFTDKRGYVHVSLVDAASGKRRRTRVLYWFRTPPGIKVGREPFDRDVKRALEEHHPDLEFDWQKLEAASQPTNGEPWKKERRPARSQSPEPLRDAMGEEGSQESRFTDDPDDEMTRDVGANGDSLDVIPLRGPESSPSPDEVVEAVGEASASAGKGPLSRHNRRRGRRGRRRSNRPV